jgi:hypothetical protein
MMKLDLKKLVERIVLNVLRDKPIVYKESRRLNLALRVEHLLRKLRSHIC